MLTKKSSNYVLNHILPILCNKMNTVKLYRKNYPEKMPEKFSLCFDDYNDEEEDEEVEEWEGLVYAICEDIFCKLFTFDHYELLDESTEEGINILNLLGCEYIDENYFYAIRDSRIKNLLMSVNYEKSKLQATIPFIVLQEFQSNFLPNTTNTTVYEFDFHFAKAPESAADLYIAYNNDSCSVYNEVIYHLASTFQNALDNYKIKDVE